MAKMNDRTLAALIQTKIADSLGVTGDTLSADRQKALKYYRGDAFGDEREGHSKIVSRDVAEAVDGLLPALLKIFTAGDETVKFEPHGPEDEQAAQQATDYVNWIFNQQNDGFRILYTWIKDALLFKVGVVKVWWDESEQITHEEYHGLTEPEYQMLVADPNIEIEAEEMDEPDEYGMQGRSVTVKKTNKEGRVCIEPVPPDEFIIERWATGLETALFCAHRFRRTVSDLIAQGFDKDKVRKAAGYELGDLQGERQERFADEDTILSVNEDGVDDETVRYVWIAETYLKVDYDGDGIAELRKVTTAGDSEYEILDNEEVDDYPFAAITPIIMPHKFHGMSIADQVMDLQVLSSTLWRQTLDNLYLANEPKTQVVKGQVNLDQLLNGGVGGIVETTRIDSMREIAVPFVANHVYPMLELIEATKEKRTGQSRYNQGLDADSLNKTATGISIIQNAAQQRQELIARVIAETGMKRLFRLILKCVTKYQQSQKMLRLRGQWVPMDPRGWKNNYDLVVAVGLGTGNKDSEAMHVDALLATSEKLIAGGKGNLVSDKNLYNMLKKRVEAAGLKSIELYFTDPDTVPPQQPQPSPEEMKAQAEIQKMQAQTQLEGQKAQATLQQKQQEAMLDGQIAQEKAALEMQIEAMKAQAAIQIEREKAAAQMEIERMKAAIQAEIAAQKAAADAQRADAQAARQEDRADSQAVSE